MAILPAVKERAKDLNELAEGVLFLFALRPIAPDAAAQKHLDDGAKQRLKKLAESLAGLNEWSAAAAEAAVRALAEAEQLKLGQRAQPSRAALPGRTVPPPLFDMLGGLGRAENRGRQSGR